VLFKPTSRKFLLLLHVITSVGFIGAVGAFLCLAVTGLVASDAVLRRAAYIAAGLITWILILPLAWATLLGGILLSIGTTWGLLRYYWVVVKLILTVLATVVLMLQVPTIAGVAELALQGDISSIGASRFSMVLHAVGGIAVLITAMVLSIYKPPGITSIGARAVGNSSHR
jgi:hypothetical protein